MDQMSFDMLSCARAYIGAGISVIPIARGSKKPDHAMLPHVYDEETQRSGPSWKPYQDRLALPGEIEHWYNRNAAGIGVVCGRVSGGLVVLDLESSIAFEDWRRYAELLRPPDEIAALPVVATGKGYHVYFRMENPIANRKLAMNGRAVVAETRGEGGYVLAPPTLHPEGREYHWYTGGMADIPMLTEEQVRGILNAARALAASADHPAQQERSASGAGGGVIGAYNAAHTVDSVLERHGYTRAGARRYIRPGGERSSVIIRRDGRSVHFNTNDSLYSEAPGGGNYAHTAFSAFCILEHSGDVSAAVRAAAAQLGMQQEHDAAQLAQAGRALGLGGGLADHPAQDAAQAADAAEDAAQAAAQAADAAEDAAQAAEGGDTYPYFIHDGGMWMKDKGAAAVLCNFTARIVAETTLCDGEHTEEHYTILATCGQRTRRIEMKRAEFESEGALARIVAALGARARVHPRAQVRFIMDAIKAFSRAIDEQTIYTHAGWVDGRYLFANGYVDTMGWHAADEPTSTRAHLPQRLERYRLTPPDDCTISQALTMLDELIELAPSSVMVPLLGGVLLAPIASTIGTPAPMIHVYGPTGCHKTSICCAALSLLGEFCPAHPTDTWTSTANSVQRLGWHLKDTAMLLDDYKAANVKPQQVTFLLQNYGDGTARGRLDANSEARAAFPIRAVLISSGEDQPEGEASTLARILSVSLPRGAVHRGRLTVVQREYTRLHLLTEQYMAWLARRPDLAPWHRQQHEETRAAILAKLEDTDNATNPGRVASNVAALYVAWRRFMLFLDDKGYWTPEQIEQWQRQCKRDLLNLARQQVELTTGERYSQLFLDAVRGLVASGRAVLMDAERDQATLEPGQVLIGAKDRHGVYLIAGTAYDEVCKHTRATGRTFGASKKAVSQLLEQDGLIVASEGGVNVCRKMVNGVRMSCWHLPPDVLES